MLEIGYRLDMTPIETGRAPQFVTNAQAFLVNDRVAIYQGCPNLRYLVPVSILVAAAALTQPAAAAQITVIVSASVAKPVELTKLQDLNFGTLILSGFSGTRVVAMSQAGVVTCPANIICSGTPTPARFNVQGSNKTVVPITVSASTMSNGTDTISFTPNAPASITLANSGAPGTDFTIGGSITVAPTVGGGLYSGTMNVTAENP